MVFRRVLIALEGTAVSAHAMTIGIDLGQALGAEVSFVHVVDPKLAHAPETGILVPVLLADQKRQGQALLGATGARLTSLPPPCQFLRVGEPSKEIIAAAREWSADLIVVGTHGRTGLTRVVLGSIAESVVRHAPCPVVVVRADDTGHACG